MKAGSLGDQFFHIRDVLAQYFCDDFVVSGKSVAGVKVLAHGYDVFGDTLQASFMMLFTARGLEKRKVVCEAHEVHGKRADSGVDVHVILGKLLSVLGGSQHDSLLTCSLSLKIQ